MGKNCTVCGVRKPLEAFHRQARAADGRQSRCKECACRIAREWSAANHERALENKKEYFRKHKDVLSEKNRAWAAAHPEQMLEYGRKYRAANPEKEKARARKYREAHKEEAKAYRELYFADKPGLKNAWDAQRRARELRATPVWADAAGIARFYDIAKEKQKETGVEWHVDHIVPLQSKFVCGLHVAHNLQVIPAADNHRKSNAFDPATFVQPSN